MGGDIHPNPGPKLRFAQLNIAGASMPARAAFAEVLRSGGDANVLVVAELRVAASAPTPDIAYFDCLYAPREAHGGGVALYVGCNAGHRVTVREVNPTLERVTAVIAPRSDDDESRAIEVSSFYCHRPAKAEDVRAMLAEATPGRPCVVAGD
jgi:hypothetical protein